MDPASRGATEGAIQPRSRRVSQTHLARRAETLRRLHDGAALLVLPNVWDPVGARVLEAHGAPAVATASAAVSASLGAPDGEVIDRVTMLDTIARIARSVDVPLTADIERGYGETIDELERTIAGVLDAGAAGINLEDSLEEGGRRRSIDAQCLRLSAARAVASARGVPLRALGVERVSVGPFLFRACLRTFVEIAGDLLAERGADRLESALWRAEVAAFLRGPGEASSG